MSKRIDNDGGAYHFYRKEAQAIQHVEEILQERQFISFNKTENGKLGTSLGDGTYLHEGEKELEEHYAPLDKELEAHYTVDNYVKSRLETPYAIEDIKDYSAELNDKIVSAQPHFDFQSNKAELILHYANGQSKVVKKSCYEIAAWLMNKSAEGIIE